MILVSRKWYTRVISLTILFALPKLLFAQLSGTIIDKETQEPIPFVKIVINNTASEVVSDIDGKFHLAEDSSVRFLCIKSPFYLTQLLLVDSIRKDSALVIRLEKNKAWSDFTPNKEGELLILNVLFNKAGNNVKNYKYYKYSTYNKATLTPEKVDKTNHSLGKIFKFFALKFNTFEENQHFLILESATERKVYNIHHHKEIIHGAKSTIADVPTLFIQTSQLHAFTPYDDFVTIAGKTFISPLASHTFNRYMFALSDTLLNAGDTIFVVQFRPLPEKQFDGLKGALYVSSKKYGINYFYATPAQEKKLKMSTIQSFRYYPEKDRWFPERTQTVVATEKSGERFTATLNTYITNVDLNFYSRKKDFDEIVLQYPNHANLQNEDFWTAQRQAPLTPYDSNTYAYYKSADQKKFIQKSLRFGEHLYYGFITYDFLDFDLRRFLDVNQLEGIRVGFGVHTNHRFSERFRFGFYFGYGFKDTENKFGLDASFTPRNIPITFKTAFSDDVHEAGGVNFPFNRYQYTSEPLRRIRLRIMDRIIDWENSISFHHFKFLDLKFSMNISQNHPTYDYQYKDLKSTTFDFTELKAGFRYAYGEQLIQLLDKKITTITPLPVFSFQYTKGFNNLFIGDFSYEKYEAKLEYTFKVLDLGTTGIQLVGGVVNGDVPYTKLFNGNGSLRRLSVVIHNSFETMRYNEFLSDRYVSLFMSHNFGRLYFKSKFFRPSLLVVHNVGFGSLSHPEYHKEIEFKTMEKGYIESGVLLDHMLVFHLRGLKIGLGPGFFLRYGPNAIEGFQNNLVLKLATKFSL